MIGSGCAAYHDHNTTGSFAIPEEPLRECLDVFAGPGCVSCVMTVRSSRTLHSIASPAELALHHILSRQRSLALITIPGTACGYILLSTLAEELTIPSVEGFSCTGIEDVFNTVDEEPGGRLGS